MGDDATVLNASLTGLLLVATGIALVYSGRAGSGERRALRWSERSGLPLTTRTAGPLIARLRRLSIAEAMAVLIGAALSAVFLPTAIGTATYFFLVVTMPMILLSGLVAGIIISVRGPLFAPPLDGPRVARVRRLRAADYLGPVRVALPWAFAVAALGVGAAAAVASAPPAPMVWCGLVVSALGVLACATLPLIDRRILERAQPAGSAVDLAWDDLVRTATFNTLRLGVATICPIGTALSLVALWGTDKPWAGWAFQLVLWGQITLGRVYPADGRGLRRDLRPSTASTRATAVAS